MHLIVWLTGGKGFIGSHLIDELEKVPSIEIYCLENKEIPLPQITRTESNPVFIALNFNDKAHLSWLGSSGEVPKPTNLLLLGWGKVDDPDSIDHQIKNVESTFLLYRAVPKTRLQKVIFFGSIDEYGSRLNGIAEGDHALPPISRYALGKSLASKKLRDLSHSLNINYQHLYVSNVYGSRQRPSALLNKMMDSDSFTFKGGNYFRDYLHVTNLCQITVSLLNSKSTLDTNVGSGVSTHSYDYVRMAWKVMSKDPLLLNFDEPEFRNISEAKYLNISRLRSQIPFDLKIDDIYLGLTKTVSGLNSR